MRGGGAPDITSPALRSANGTQLFLTLFKDGQHYCSLVATAAAVVVKISAFQSVSPGRLLSDKAKNISD